MWIKDCLAALNNLLPYLSSLPLSPFTPQTPNQNKVAKIVSSWRLLTQHRISSSHHQGTFPLSGTSLFLLWGHCPCSLARLFYLLSQQWLFQKCWFNVQSPFQLIRDISGIRNCSCAVSSFSWILHVFGSQGFFCNQFSSQFYFLYSHVVWGSPRPLPDHRIPFMHRSSPSSRLPLFTPAWAQLRWEPAWCCQGSWEIYFNRLSKACQNIAPGQRVVCSGRLSAPQSASWQWFFCILTVSPNIMVLPYFGFILNSRLHALNFIASFFPLRATGMNGDQ